MKKESLFAHPEVFYAALVAHFAEPLQHYGVIVHQTLELLERACGGGLIAEDVLPEGAPHSSRPKRVPLATLLDSEIFKNARWQDRGVTKSSGSRISRGDGRCYETWAVSSDCTDYFGQPNVRASTPFNRLEMNVALPLLKKMGQARYIQLVNEVFAMCAAQTPECVYGLVDIMSAAESSGGRCYSSAAAGGDWCGWHRLLEQYDWAYQDERRYESVQGVYWGNYLGPRILAKFKDPDKFMEAFRNFGQGRYENRGHTATVHGSGCLLLTSSYPMQLAEPDFAGASYEARVAAWLRQEFRRARVL